MPIPAAFGLPTILLLGLASGLIPIYLSYSLWDRVGAARAKRFLPALAVGVLFWSLYDLLQETAGLGIGTASSWTQAISLSLLALGVVASGYASAFGTRQRLPYILAYVWSLGLAFHSAGEGIVMGHDFGTGESILDFAQGASFVLHKFAEGTTVFAILALARFRPVDLAATGLIAGGPVALGAATGFLGAPGGLAVFMFSLAAGSTIYVISFLVSRFDVRSIRHVLVMVLGLLLMYGAGLLHQLP